MNVKKKKKRKKEKKKKKTLRSSTRTWYIQHSTSTQHKLTWNGVTLGSGLPSILFHFQLPHTHYPLQLIKATRVYPSSLISPLTFGRFFLLLHSGTQLTCPTYTPQPNQTKHTQTHHSHIVRYKKLN